MSLFQKRLAYPKVFSARPPVAIRRQPLPDLSQFDGSGNRSLARKLDSQPLMKPGPAKTSKTPAVKVAATNRKAFHDYFIDDRAEAGLALTGTEVKSLRAGRAQLKDSYVQVRDGEAFLVGAHISTYAAGSWTNHLPERDRKLLLHRRELD